MKKILLLCIFFILIMAGYSSYILNATEPVTTATQPYFSTSQVTILSTATAIVGSNANRSSITICDISANNVYIGNTSSVAATTGKRLRANECITMDRNYGAIYGITSSGNSQVDYIEE